MNSGLTNELDVQKETEIGLILVSSDENLWKVGKNIPKLKRTLPNSQNVPQVQVKTYLLRVVISRTVVHVITLS